MRIYLPELALLIGVSASGCASFRTVCETPAEVSGGVPASACVHQCAEKKIEPASVVPSVAAKEQTQPAKASPSKLHNETNSFEEIVYGIARMRPLEATVHSDKDDGPAELIKQNAELKDEIIRRQQDLDRLHQNYRVHAINSGGEPEFTKADNAWKELCELDSLFAARGEHGYSLARYLYLQEKLARTNERIKYIKKTFND